MKFSLQVELHCTVTEAFTALHNPDVFRKVSSPFLRFRPLSPTVFPERYVSGHSYVVSAYALGFIPLGTQEINPVTTSTGTERTFLDNGRGLSGALATVTRFRHRMHLSPSGHGPTVLTDELEFEAGILTPLMGLSFRLFWWWRHLKMKKLAPSWQSDRVRMWEARYRAGDMWSGKPNPTLLDSLPDASPGSALEVGCGEGADALWLAEQGFDVTAVDASPAALARGERERVTRVSRDHRPRIIRWIASDVLEDDLPTPPEHYDLVTAHFVHLPQDEREVLWAKLVGAVAPGGTLLIVGHSQEDVAAGVRRPPVELMFEGSEVLSVIPSRWSSRSAELRTRTQSRPDGKTHTVQDVVITATR